MSTHSNGGPAFPSTERDQISGQIHDQHMGMTLRDYFAAQALGGVISTCEREPGGATSSLSAADIARASYEFADAMLAERAK